MSVMQKFTASKGFLICEGAVLMMLRDDVPNIPFPNMWDLIGGAREEGETPFECLSRETEEECNISISEDQVVWRREYPSIHHPEKRSFMFTLEISAEQVNSIKLGDEGQKLKMMSFEEFFEKGDVIPHFKDRPRDFFKENTKKMP